jgi:hypothetical protein
MEVVMMRKTMLAVGLALTSMLTMSVGNAAVLQKEHGQTLVPHVGKVFGIRVDGCPGIVAANVQFATGVSVHPSFAVKSVTWGHAFTVEPRKYAGRYLANIDITFLRSGGSVAFAKGKLGGEKGIVPVGATRAYVCLAYGVPSRFTYRAT